jgi:hypothetical protein
LGPWLANTVQAFDESFGEGVINAFFAPYLNKQHPTEHVLREARVAVLLRTVNPHLPEPLLRPKPEQGGDRYSTRKIMGSMSHALDSIVTLSTRLIDAKPSDLPQEVIVRKKGARDAVAYVCPALTGSVVRRAI